MLKPLRPGKIKCLKCQKPFESRDVVTNRICLRCTRENQREYVPRISGSNVWKENGGIMPPD